MLEVVANVLGVLLSLLALYWAILPQGHPREIPLGQFIGVCSALLGVLWALVPSYLAATLYLVLGIVFVVKPTGIHWHRREKP